VRTVRILSSLGLAGAACVGLALPGSPAAAAARVQAAAVTLVSQWSHTESDAGSATVIYRSSPMVVPLSGGPAAVVGDGAGHLYAYYLNGGGTVPGWPASTGGAPVDSTPSVNGSTIFVGTGDTQDPAAGGYEAFGANGRPVWSTTISAQPGSTSKAGVESSLAVGDLQGGQDVVSGSLGQMEDALSAANGSVLRGFPYFQADTNFSTPALADLYRNGQNQIIEGGEVTTGNAYGVQYYSGGLFRVVGPTGNRICQVNTTGIAIDSSPAVGEFLSGGSVGVVVGAAPPNNRYAGNELYGYNARCGQVWVVHLDADTESSPALVDALGNGGLQIAEGTDTGSAGSVYLINGANGATIWEKPAIGRVVGGIVSANLGAGYQDLVVPTTNGLEIFDGRSGAVLATATGFSLQNSPLVTDDPNGRIGITAAGIGVGGNSVIEHWEVSGSRGSVVNEKGAWPMFHHDPQLTGSAGTPGPVRCSAPLSPRGYWMDASDGGIFSFGNLPFCGSTGNIALNKPIVGMAGTQDAGGYWLVASDGGIFTFGDAHYYGSTGALHLHQPIVGMAATPDGKGYWLVAADGGIFTFGDAHFHGSTGALHLKKPIVGMGTYGPTGGYWLVASDGGIFAFDAPYYGSTGGISLTKPIVGMSGY
jgi:hypothetical protein